jgi:ribonucleotide reductase alpha subunit
MELLGNALKVLEARYLLKDENGDIIESPKQMFGRIARAIAGAEKLYKVGRLFRPAGGRFDAEHLRYPEKRRPHPAKRRRHRFFVFQAEAQI